MMLLILITVVSTGKVTSDYYSLLNHLCPIHFIIVVMVKICSVLLIYSFYITMLTVFFSHIQVMLCYYIAFSYYMIHGLEFFLQFFSLPFFFFRNSKLEFTVCWIPPFLVLYWSLFDNRIVIMWHNNGCSSNPSFSLLFAAEWCRCRVAAPEARVCFSCPGEATMRRLVSLPEPVPPIQQLTESRRVGVLCCKMAVMRRSRGAADEDGGEG